jgi:hypothetical protein
MLLEEELWKNFTKYQEKMTSITMDMEGNFEFLSIENKCMLRA